MRALKKDVLINLQKKFSSDSYYITMVNFIINFVTKTFFSFSRLIRF